MNEEQFRSCWISSKTQGKDTGTALLLEPTPDFYSFEDDKQKQEKNLGYFLRYLFPYKSQMFQLVAGMLTHIAASARNYSGTPTTLINLFYPQLII